jgi:hypothetical protein
LPISRSSTPIGNLERWEAFDQVSVFKILFTTSGTELLIFADTVVPQETLRKADEIFGAENKDLLRSFQGLLSRSLS